MTSLPSQEESAFKDLLPTLVERLDQADDAAKKVRIFPNHKSSFQGDWSLRDPLNPIHSSQAL